MIRVDEEQKDYHFGYKNQNGIIEFVEKSCEASTVFTIHASGIRSNFYIKDAPNLIKAIQEVIKKE